MIAQGVARAAVMAVAVMAGACAGERHVAVQTSPALPPAPVRLDTIVLLPDEGVDTAGRLVVGSSTGDVVLTEPWASTRVPPDGPPQVAASLSDDMREHVHDVLDALPLAPAQFTLHFNLDSEQLTAESLARVADVRAAVTGRPAVEVFISGHTDRSGPAEANVVLGLTRAASIRDLLISAGVPAAAVRITSHGEATPIVPTRDGTFEPRNRRVEISVR